MRTTMKFTEKNKLVLVGSPGLLKGSFKFSLSVLYKDRDKYEEMYKAFIDGKVVYGKVVDGKVVYGEVVDGNIQNIAHVAKHFKAEEEEVDIDIMCNVELQTSTLPPDEVATNNLSDSPTVVDNNPTDEAVQDDPNIKLDHKQDKLINSPPKLKLTNYEDTESLSGKYIQKKRRRKTKPYKLNTDIKQGSKTKLYEVNTDDPSSSSKFKHIKALKKTNSCRNEIIKFKFKNNTKSKNPKTSNDQDKSKSKKTSVKACTEDDDFIFKCSLCNFKTQSLNSYELHKLSIHSERRKFYCLYCHTKYESHVILKEHIKKTHQIKRKYNVQKKKSLYNVQKKESLFNAQKKEPLFNVQKKEPPYNTQKKEPLFNVQKKKPLYNVQKKELLVDPKCKIKTNKIIKKQYYKRLATKKIQLLPKRFVNVNTELPLLRTSLNRSIFRNILPKPTTCQKLLAKNTQIVNEESYVNSKLKTKMNSTSDISLEDKVSKINNSFKIYSDILKMYSTSNNEQSNAVNNPKNGTKETDISFKKGVLKSNSAFDIDQTKAVTVPRNDTDETDISFKKEVSKTSTALNDESLNVNFYRNILPKARMNQKLLVKNTQCKIIHVPKNDIISSKDGKKDEESNSTQQCKKVKVINNINVTSKDDNSIKKDELKIVVVLKNQSKINMSSNTKVFQQIDTILKDRIPKFNNVLNNNLNNKLQKTEINKGVNATNTSSLLYKCTCCEFKSQHTSIIFDHQKDIHDNWPKVQCPICLLHCFKEEELQAHMRKHQCSECDYFCVNLKTLNQHYVLAHPDVDRPYTCNLCGEKFISEVYFENHDKTHSSMISRYQCPLCIYRCVGYNVLKYHIKNTHPGVKKPYNCDECDQKFTSQKYLQLHKGRHAISECNHKCPLCTYQCLRLKLLRAHIKEEHPGVKNPWSCLECGDAFRFKRYLKAHQKEHALLDHLECPCCTYKCMKYKLLRQHLTIKHADIKKPYKCPVCAETFKQEHHLRSHERDHATSVHYDCPLCTYKCIRYKLLKPHFVQMHPEIPKPYSCLKCGERFRLAVMLRNHDIIRHSVDIVNHKAMEECKLEHQKQSFSHGYLIKGVSKATEASSVNKISLPKTVPTNSNAEACDFENCSNVSPSLQKHDEHPAVRCYKCNLCAKEYESYEILQEHMETHDIKLKCKCTTCYYECHDLNEMKEHLNRHLSAKEDTKITHSHSKATKYSVSKKSMKILRVQKKVKRKFVKEQSKSIIIETLTKAKNCTGKTLAFNVSRNTFSKSTREKLLSQVEESKIPIAKKAAKRNSRFMSHMGVRHLSKNILKMHQAGEAINLVVETTPLAPHVQQKYKEHIVGMPIKPYHVEVPFKKDQVLKTQSDGEPEGTVLVKRPVSFPSAKKLRKSHFIVKALQTYVDDEAINIVLVDESLYQCQLCCYKGNFSKWLLHAKVHNIETTYKCLYCHQLFIDKTVLYLHIKFIHQL